MELAYMGYVDIQTPNFDESVYFFKELVGLEESFRTDDKVYLRAWADYDRYTLVLTRSDSAGLVEYGLRTKKPAYVQAYAERLNAQGIAVTHLPAGSRPGMGEAIRFIAEGGQAVVLYYDIEKFKPGPKASTLISQAQRNPFRGMNVRRLDHINLSVPDVNQTKDFYCNLLDFNLREYAVDSQGITGGAWMAVTSQVHDVALIRQPAGKTGRLHHIGFYLDTRDELLRTCDVLAEAGYRLEAGPGRHGPTQACYLYFIEPGGNRIELFSGGNHVYAPDWEPVRWDFTDINRTVVWWGVDMPDQFYLYDS